MCGENPLICLIYSACSVCQILAQSINSRSCGGEENKYNEGPLPGCNKTSQSLRGNLGNGTQNPGSETGICSPPRLSSSPLLRRAALSPLWRTVCVCVEDEEDGGGGGLSLDLRPNQKDCLFSPEFNLVLSCLLNLSPPSSTRVLPSLPLSPSSLSFSLAQSYHPLAASWQPPPLTTTSPSSSSLHPPSLVIFLFFLSPIFVVPGAVAIYI